MRNPPSPASGRFLRRMWARHLHTLFHPRPRRGLWQRMPRSTPWAGGRNRPRSDPATRHPAPPRGGGIPGRCRRHRPPLEAIRPGVWPIRGLRPCPALVVGRRRRRHHRTRHLGALDTKEATSREHMATRSPDQRGGVGPRLPPQHPGSTRVRADHRRPLRRPSGGHRGAGGGGEGSPIGDATERGGTIGCSNGCRAIGSLR